MAVCICPCRELDDLDELRSGIQAEHLLLGERC